MKKIKINKFFVRRIVAVIFIIAICICIGNLITKYSYEEQTKQTRLLLNNELVNLSNNIYVENDVIYISEEDVKDVFDSTIYYNVGDQELITTYNRHVTVLHLNQNQAIVNDSNVNIKGCLKEIDSKIYLPLSDLEIVYDIEVEYVDSNNLVIVDSTLKSKMQSMALEKTKLKKRQRLV